MGLYLVMKNNFRRSFHHKLLFLVTFLLPVILCVGAGTIRFEKTSIRVGILGMETNPSVAVEQSVLTALFDRSKGIKYAFAKEASVQTDLITGKYHVVLDYRESATLEDFRFLSHQNKNKSQMVEAMFREAIRNQKAIQLSTMRPIGLSIKERNMAILLSLFLLIATLHASRIIGDKKDGILQRYRFAKQSGKGYIMGYLTYNVIITYLQVVLCMGVLMLLQREFTLTLIEGIVIPVTITLIAAVFSMLICLASRSEVQSNITASAIAAIFSILGGTFIATSSMPELLRVISFASPIRWVVELIRVL